MRLIGHLTNEATARTFSDYLYVQGISNQIEPESDGAWAIWIHAEEEIERGKQLLARFREQPANAEFQDAARAAVKRREQEQADLAEYQKRFHDGREVVRQFAGYRMGPLTVALLVISIAVFVLSKFGANFEPLHSLFIAEHNIRGSVLDRFGGLREIWHGEIWRLLTPIFLHFHILHILFNLLWLRDLGSMIEARQNTGRLAVLVLVLAAGSNLAQFLATGYAGFGGMSGVVYGLFGYVWIKGKFDPGSGLFMQPVNVAIMMVWFFLCFTGLLGPIANGAHTAGLVMGAAWGYLASLRKS
jgi:GlpG protein